MEEWAFAHGQPCSYAPGRNRTYDLALRRRALYPLSYGREATTVAAARVPARRALTLQGWQSNP